MIRLESCLMRDIKAKVGLSSFFFSFPCLYLMLLCYWPPSPKGEWEVVSHLLPILLILFFFSLGIYSSCIFIRMPCLFATPCVYLVICLAIFVFFDAFVGNCTSISLTFWYSHSHCSHCKTVSGYKITVLQSVYTLLLMTLFQDAYIQDQDQGKILMISWLGHSVVYRCHRPLAWATDNLVSEELC